MLNKPMVKHIPQVGANTIYANKKRPILLWFTLIKAVFLTARNFQNMIVVLHFLIAEK